MNDNAELIKKVEMGEKRAADILVEQNMGLVYSIVKRFKNRRCEHDDLVQIGSIGLIKAVKKFDSSFGVQFSTYAVPMIIGEIKRFLRDDGAIKVSRSLKESAVKGRYAEEMLIRKLGRKPTISEISNEIGITVDELSQAFDAAAEPESLMSSVGGDENENSIRLLERLVSDDTEEKIVDKVFIKEALSKLNSRESKILVMRYFKGKTQNEIAEIIGVSQVQISRIEKKALLKMRESAMEGY